MVVAAWYRFVGVYMALGLMIRCFMMFSIRLVGLRGLNGSILEGNVGIMVRCNCKILMLLILDDYFVYMMHI